MQRRLWIVVAIIGAAAIAAGVLVATSTQRSEAEVAIDDSPPAWLQKKVKKALTAYPADHVESVTWLLTTVGKYHDVVPEQGKANTDYADKPIYVVVANGKFEQETTRGGEVETIDGRQLLLVYDGKTHGLSVVGILTTPFDASKLETAEPLEY